MIELINRKFVLYHDIPIDQDSKKETQFNIDYNCSKVLKQMQEYFTEYCGKNNDSNKVAERKRCADIITNDYLKIYKKIISNEIIGSISVVDNSIYHWRIKMEMKDNPDKLNLNKIKSMNTLIIDFLFRQFSKENYKIKIYSN
jgi:hypothetical protein